MTLNTVLDENEISEMVATVISAIVKVATRRCSSILYLIDDLIDSSSNILAENKILHGQDSIYLNHNLKIEWSFDKNGKMKVSFIGAKKDTQWLIKKVKQELSSSSIDVN